MTTINVKIDEYINAFLNTVLRDLRRCSSSFSNPTSMMLETGCFNDDCFSSLFSFCDSVSDALYEVSTPEMSLPIVSSKVAIARVPEKS